MRETYPSQDAPAVKHETFTLRGLIIYSAIVPLAMLMLTVPAVLVAVTLGATSALAVRRARPLLRRVFGPESDGPSRPTGQ